MATILEQYRISDFLEWSRERKLILNPEFQRGQVWTPVARTYLIDTILRELPIPKIYLRTLIDVESKQSLREVVDGQQRLRAIIDFSNDKFALSKRAEEFAGLKYSTLAPRLQEVFLSYPISVGQLLNASVDDVLEIFSRLNSYNVTLNRPERRHAKYQGEFKWTVHKAAQRWPVLWDEYRIVSVRNRVRMLHDSLVAEMLGVLLDGVRDGGQPKIDAIYGRYDANFDAECEEVIRLHRTLEYLVEHLVDPLRDTPLLSAPHFLMLFAAVAHALFGIPEGEMKEEMPERNPAALTDVDLTRENLILLAAIVDSVDQPKQMVGFWRASASTTHRIASRRVRFPVYYRALLPQAF